MKYSHNSFYNKNLFQDTIDAGLDALELDIVYSLFRNLIFVSHSWRPSDKLYCGTLYGNLLDIYANNYRYPFHRIEYLIIESKSFWVPTKILYGILKRFNEAQGKRKCKIVMSVQSKYPHQWIRGIWLKSFYKKYKEELGILDKRTEKMPDGTYLNQQVDLYRKGNIFQRFLWNQF